MKTQVQVGESSFKSNVVLEQDTQEPNRIRSEWQIMYEQYKRSSEFLKKSYSDLLSREILEKQGKDIFSLANIFKEIADSNIKLAQSDDNVDPSLKLQYCNDAAIACHHGLSVIGKADDRVPSLQELESLIYGNLNIVQTILVSLCGGNLNHLSQINSREDIDIISNRYMLEQLRNETKDHLKAIETAKEDKDDPAYIERTASLFKQIAKAIENYLVELYKDAQEIIGTPPCDYTVIGLGSMALRQMTPYSDLEFAILTANEDYKQSDDFKVKEYFKNLTEIVHFKVINLGETIMPISSYGFDFADFVKTAVNFDLGGKTPLGRIDKPYELIQTIEGMYDYLRNGWDKTSHIDKTLLFILQKTCLVYQYGETDLAAKYQNLAQEFLLSIDASNNRPYCENRAVQILYKGGVEIDYTKQEPTERKPTPGNLEQFSFEGLGSRGKLFDVKQEIYRMPDRFIYNLGLIHGVQEESSWDTIDKLREKWFINERGSFNLKKALSFATNLRLKTYSHYGYQKDTMDFDKIYSTETVNNRSEDKSLAQELTTLFRLTREDLKPEGTLFEYYYVALALTDKLKEFCESHDKGEQTQSFFVETDFYKNDVDTKAKVNLRLLRYEEALGYQLKELAILEQALGKDHPAVAASYNNVGYTYGALGNHQKALGYQLKALEISEQALGKDHPDVATSYNNVGYTYGALGNHQKALEYKVKALEIWEQALGKDHPHVATSYNNVGMTYGELGNHRKALEYLLKALAIREQALGKDHPDVAASYNNVGITYGKLDNHHKALEYQVKALTISEQALGKDHPTVAASYNNVGYTYGALGNHQKALGYQLKASAIREQALGNDHPAVAASYNNVGMTYGELGDHQKALEYLLKASAIREQALGKDHPAVAVSYSNVGYTYGQLGNYQQALEYLLKALAILEQALGKDHPDVAASYNNIGHIYEDLDNRQKALEYLLKALAIREQALGKDHPTVAASYNNVGMTYGELGDHQKALGYLLKALAIREQAFCNTISQYNSNVDDHWYNDVEITSLLRTQINESQGNITAITRFENRSLLEDNLKNALEGIRNDGIPVLMPIHVHGNHWVGAMIRKQIDDNIQVIYNDPRGNSIQDEENVVSFISMIQQYAPEANIIDLQIKPQKNDDDCGPFTVDNLVRLALVYNIDNYDREQLISMEVLPRNNTGSSIREAHRKLLNKIEEGRNSADEPKTTDKTDVLEEVSPVSAYSGTDLSLISDTSDVTTPDEEEIFPLGDLDRET